MDSGTSAVAVAAITASAVPAKILVEKVCNAMGMFFEPTMVKLNAIAQADADVTRAVARIEVSEVEQRGLLRMVREQGRMQENIENITAKASQALNEDAKPEEMNDDWITNFFDKCKLASDSEMQSLWAKLLAGEANKKGSFAKKTVELVAALEPEDARLFTKFCGFAWQINSRYPLTPLILDIAHPIYRNQGMDYGLLAHFEGLGLTRLGTTQASLTVTFGASPVYIGYRGKPFMIATPTPGEIMLRTGITDFTQAGAQIAQVCGSVAVPGLEEYVLTKLGGDGRTITPLKKAVLKDDIPT